MWCTYALRNIMRYPTPLLQASRWRHFVSQLSAWLNALATLFEGHKAATSANEANVRAMLKQRREVRGQRLRRAWQLCACLGVAQRCGMQRLLLGRCRT